jgi:hypothetical protein
VFIQVVKGMASDPTAVRAALDEWMDDLSPSAEGWLGTTAGVTADGHFIAVVRFDTAEAAQANSDRPEQGAWWARTEPLLAGATFQDSTKVIVDLVSDPSRAGFVQIMQGHGTDPERAAELMTRDSDKWAEFRPEILASVGAMHPGGDYTMTIYFTNEAEAREGERKEPPPELKAQMDEMQTLATGVPTFFDLPDPWLYAPR